MDNYIQIMLESLKKKSVILDRILAKNEVQAKCLESGEYDSVDWDTFNITVTEKEAEIKRINEMDDGFQALYDRVGNQLKDSKDKYSCEIKEMQRIILELEEKSVKIRTGEERNRAMIEKVMVGRKQEIKQVRMNLKVASNYYKSMQSSLNVDYTSVDSKK